MPTDHAGPRTTAPGSPDWLRPLGATGLHVTAVSVGGGPLGSIPRQAGREGALDDGVALAAYVLDSPARVLDTSNGYSDGESERRIGAAIALLDGRVQHRGNAEVIVRADDTADLNARLVAAGVRVTGLEPVRRTLEQVVLEATES